MDQSSIINLFFRVTKIPDLTLNKYCSGENNGVQGMLDKHNAFLRQWNRKGNISGASIHLFYLYNTQKPQGDKLDIYILVRGKQDSLHNAIRMMESSPFSDDYGLELMSDMDVGGLYKYIFSSDSDGLTEDDAKKEIKNKTHFNVSSVAENVGLFNQQFNKCTTLSKREIFITPSTAVTEGDMQFYTLSEWEMSETARLYQMLSMMKTIDRDVMYRVDLYPVDVASTIRQYFSYPIKMINRRQDDLKKVSFSQRDLESERVLKNYEDISEKIEASPHFYANIFVFGDVDDKSDDISVVLDAAGSEALEKGNYTISNFTGTFEWNSFIDNAQSMKGNSGEDYMHIIPMQDNGVTVCNEKSIGFNANFLPVLFTLEETLPFFRLPALYEDETIEKRKETAPPAVESEKGLFLGNDTNGYDVYFPLDKLAKHAFISGVPGSGKTNTMHHITSSLWKREQPIPFLVLEPAKQEYRALANQPGMEDLYVFSPNADMSFPLHINPFEFPKGLMVAEHIRRLCSVFEGAFPLDNPMPFLLDSAIEAVYREMGWTPETVYTNDTKLKFPTMSMLYKKLEDELETTKYSDEVRGNLESALKVRIGSLLRREMGDVFDVPESTIPPEKWLEIPAVIELESMGSGPANFLTLMLCALIREVLKVNPQCDKDHARHIIFIEEAHNLIGPVAEEVTGGEANAKQAATAFVVKMLAEVRALKEGIVIADQLPTVMAPEVIKNTGLKIGLRITSADDRGLLGSTMAANAIQMEEMATFEPGEALISYEGLMKPFKMRMSKWGSKDPESENKNLDDHKNDAELKELMCGRKSYQEILQRSAIINGKKLCRKYLKLLEVEDKYIHDLTRLKDMNIAIQALETARKVMLMQTPDYDKTEMRKITEEINIQREARDKYRNNSEYCSEVVAYIIEYLRLFKAIDDKRQKWEREGTVDTKQILLLELHVIASAKKIYTYASRQIEDKGIHDSMKSLQEKFKKLNNKYSKMKTERT